MQMRVKLNQLSWGEVKIIRGLIGYQRESLCNILQHHFNHLVEKCQREGIEVEKLVDKFTQKIEVLDDLVDHPEQFFSMLTHEDLSTMRHILTQKDKKYQREYPEELKAIKIKFSTFRGLIQTVNLN